MIITAEVKLRVVTQAADALKAEDILILDLKGISTFTDYFVLASVGSQPQLRAVTREIYRRLAAERIPSPRADGLESEHWVVLDLGDVVVHLFDAPTRSHYNLEALWGDAQRVDMANFLTA